MASDPDATLMVAFQRGDESAFRALFEKYGRSMVGYCNHFVRDPARAEELAQDVFLNLHRSAARYRPSARFKTFLYRIASNLCLNELRRAEHGLRAERERATPGVDDETTDLEALPGDVATPEQMAVGSALEKAFGQLLAKLPEKQRAALVMARLEGLSYEEIAEILGTTVAAVKSLVHRATMAAATALAPFTGGDVREELS
jgi:RNA polymerase sigma-70 factor (ECF subfamily)